MSDRATDLVCGYLCMVLAMAIFSVPIIAFIGNAPPIVVAGSVVILWPLTALWVSDGLGYWGFWGKT